MHKWLIMKYPLMINGSEIDEEDIEEKKIIEEEPLPIPPIYNGKDSYMVNTCNVVGKEPPSPENC